MRFSKAVVKCRVPILILALLLMIPSAVGMAKTRINYDMLDYLPEDMDTVIGQNDLMEDFGKGAFSFIVIDGMSDRDVDSLCERIKQVEHVETVLWYSSLADITIPKELLPDSIYNEFNNGDSTLVAVFLDSATSADVTMDAIRQIRSVCGSQCFVSGMSALVTDLKDLCEEEEPVYVGIAVLLACAAMVIFLDNWLIPFVFLASIGMMILLNMGTNFFFGEISYITKALSAVLQLAVTMDYSIFLWHSYNEQRRLHSDPKDAMAAAIHATLTSVIGSSVTTVAGFIALCFMSFTLGKDLGIVMAKGVVLGVIGCVTVLPSMILLLDRPLQKLMHKSLIPDMKYALGLESVIGSAVPEEILPDSIRSILKSDRWELLLINSEYKVAGDEVNDQIDSLNSVIKRYDSSAMLIGEAPCMKDMIETTGHDFEVVNAVSIIAIFIIIAVVEKSLSLPFILIAVIELAIFINLGLPHYLGQSLPFIAPICISTIQLGATVDYAILMTTRYKAERLNGCGKREAVSAALAASVPSIIVSGMGLFAATFGVAIYSDIDIISSMCMLMARGAVVSVVCVIFILPALLMLCDRIVIATTLGMRKLKKHGGD